MRLLLVFSFSLLLLTGALGLKSTAECDNPPDGHVPRTSELIECYHIAAVTAAYLQDSATAQAICEDIWLRFGTPGGAADTDLVDRAELETNNCFFDVARIVRDPNICYSVRKRTSDFGSRLFGEVATQEMCLNETGNLAQLQPQNYYQNNPNSLCALIFVLPFLLFVVLSKN